MKEKKYKKRSRFTIIECGRCKTRTNFKSIHQKKKSCSGCGVKF